MSIFRLCVSVMRSVSAMRVASSLTPAFSASFSAVTAAPSTSWATLNCSSNGPAAFPSMTISDSLVVGGIKRHNVEVRGAPGGNNEEPLPERRPVERFVGGDDK